MPLTLGVRYWDHVVPLALGEVGRGFVSVRMSDTTQDLWRILDNPQHQRTQAFLARFL